MKHSLLIITGLLVLALTGCAAATKKPEPGRSVYENSTADVDSLATTAERNGDPAMIVIECQSAHRLGCRLRGRIYPWNAWVEEMGYPSSSFIVKDVQQSGSRATVFINKR